MAWVMCSGCKEWIEIPDEIYDASVPLNEPYYCDACDQEDSGEESLWDEGEPEWEEDCS